MACAISRIVRLLDFVNYMLDYLMIMPVSETNARIEAVRDFNRFYTRQIGLLREGLLNSPFSLTEARLLYELAQRDDRTAGELGRELGLDAGYLSRILKKFEQKKLIRRVVAQADRRQMTLALTPLGRKQFEPLNAASNAEIASILSRLSVTEQVSLVRSMETIQKILGPRSTTEPYVIRPPQPGDMGWIIHRHGALYAQEYGWNEEFEALVAEVVAEFMKNFDAKAERCWIAERHGEIVGSIFLVRKDDDTAKLRLFYVEPSARGLGIGKRLVDECLRFAKQVGYKTVTLWTQSNLDAARHIYQQAGFKRTSRQKHKSFGKALVAEVWEKTVASD